MSDIIKLHSEGPLVLTLCLEEGSILLNKNVMLSLGQPQQVQILINEEQKMLLLKACTLEDQEAVIVPPSYQGQFEVSGHALLRRIRKLTGWGDNCPRQIQGILIPEHDAVMFNLQQAIPVMLKPSGLIQ